MTAFPTPAEYQQTIDEIRCVLLKAFADRPSVRLAKDKDDLARLEIYFRATRLQVRVALYEARRLFQA